MLGRPCRALPGYLQLPAGRMPFRLEQCRFKATLLHVVSTYQITCHTERVMQRALDLIKDHLVATADEDGHCLWASDTAKGSISPLVRRQVSILATCK